MGIENASYMYLRKRRKKFTCNVYPQAWIRLTYKMFLREHIKIRGKYLVMQHVKHSVNICDLKNIHYLSITLGFTYVLKNVAPAWYSVICPCVRQNINEVLLFWQWPESLQDFSKGIFYGSMQSIMGFFCVGTDGKESACHFRRQETEVRSLD